MRGDKPVVGTGPFLIPIEGKVTRAKTGSPFRRRVTSAHHRLLIVKLTKLALITTVSAWIYPTRALGAVTSS